MGKNRDRFHSHLAGLVRPIRSGRPPRYLHLYNRSECQSNTNVGIIFDQSPKPCGGQRGDGYLERGSAGRFVRASSKRGLWSGYGARRIRYCPGGDTTHELLRYLYESVYIGAVAIAFSLSLSLSTSGHNPLHTCKEVDFLFHTLNNPSLCLGT